MKQFVETYFDVMLWLAVIASAFTMIAYHVVSPWYTTSTGRRLMNMLGMKFLLLAALVWHRFLYLPEILYIPLLESVFTLWTISIFAMGWNILGSSDRLRRYRNRKRDHHA